MKSLLYILLLLPLTLSAGTVNYDIAITHDDCIEEYNTQIILVWEGLYLGHDGAGPNSVGLRYRNIAIPQGATISSAIVTFTAMENLSGTTVDLAIYGEDTASATVFTNITDWDARIQTTATAGWTVPAWTNNQEYDSPDLTTIIQEIVDRGDWVYGNDIVLFFLDDGSAESAYRVAFSYDDSPPPKAPSLEIVFDIDPAECDIVNSFTMLDSTINSFTIRNTYTTDTTLDIGDTTWLYWGTDTALANAIDSVRDFSLPFGPPDELQATGLDSNTTYYWHWVTNYGTCYDISAVDSVTTDPGQGPVCQDIGLSLSIVDTGKCCFDVEATYSTDSTVTSVVLYWDTNSVLEGFIDSIADLSPGATTTTLASFDLDSVTLYYFWWKTNYGTCVDISDWSSVTTEGTPACPLLFHSITVPVTTGVSFLVVDNYSTADSVVEFKLLWNETDDPSDSPDSMWDQILTDGPDSIWAVDLKPNTKYYFWVISQMTTGCPDTAAIDSATTQNVSIDTLADIDLPYTTTGAAQHIRYTGSITSGTNGILVNHDNVVIDGGIATRDTLTFCTNGTNDRYGIQLGQGVVGTIIHGGHIKCDGLDTPELDTTWNSICIDLYGDNTDVLVHRVWTTTQGWECNNVGSSTSEGGYENIDVLRGRHLSKQYGFYNRMDYNETTIRLQGALAHTGSDYTLQIKESYLTSIHGAIEMSEGVNQILFHITGCSIIVDARNDYWDDAAPTAADWQGSINAQGIGFIGAKAGSQIAFNWILSDSNYNGCDVGIIFEGADGDSANPIEIHHNTIRISRGPDAYYHEDRQSGADAKGMKWRNMETWPEVNQWVDVYNNNITILVDGDESTDYRLGGGHGIMPQTDYSKLNEHDHHIRIFNNTVTGIVTSEVDRDIVAVSCFSFQIDQSGGSRWLDNNNEIYGNRLKSDNWIYTVGPECYDQGGAYARVYNDTIEFGDDTTNFAVFAFGDAEQSGYNNVGNEFIDLVFLGGCDDTYRIEDNTSGTGDYTLRRIMELHVRAASGPIENAVCTLWNDYGTVVIIGTTDVNGNVTDTVSYEYQSITVSDSSQAAFNDFIFTAWSGGESLVDTFTVQWEPAGGVDTLVFDEPQPVKLQGAYMKGARR